MCIPHGGYRTEPKVKSVLSIQLTIINRPKRALLPAEHMTPSILRPLFGIYAFKLVLCVPVGWSSIYHSGTPGCHPSIHVIHTLLLCSLLLVYKNINMKHPQCILELVYRYMLRRTISFLSAFWRDPRTDQ